MTIDQLQGILAQWQDPVLAAEMVQQRRDDLEASIIDPEVNISLKVVCIQALAELNANEQDYIKRHIAAYQDAIANYEDELE